MFGRKMWQRLARENTPHQKPRELIRTLITATTNERDLVVDPCAGSFIVLERKFLGCDLTFEEMENFLKIKERKNY